MVIGGLSRENTKASHRVACYLQSADYLIIPVNPFAEEILGEKASNRVLDMLEPIEIEDIFNPSEDMPPTVEEAIQLKRRLGTPNVI